MLHDSNNSSIRLVVAEEVPFLVVSEDLLSRIKKWVQFCVDQEGITHAWIGRVDEKSSIQWVASWPFNALQNAFPARNIQDVIQTKEIRTFRNHDELVSGGLFPLIHKDRVIGVLGLLSNQTDYFKPSAITWISALTRMIADSLFERDSTYEEKQFEQEITRILQSSLDVRER